MARAAATKATATSFVLTLMSLNTAVRGLRGRTRALLSRQAFGDPLRHSAAQPVDLLVAGVARHHRGLVALPAFAGIAEEHERRVLVRGQLGEVELVLRAVELDLLRALLAIRDALRALDRLVRVLGRDARVDQRHAPAGHFQRVFGAHDLHALEAGRRIRGPGAGEASPADDKAAQQTHRRAARTLLDPVLVHFISPMHA